MQSYGFLMCLAPKNWTKTFKRAIYLGLFVLEIIYNIDMNFTTVYQKQVARI